MSNRRLGKVSDAAARGQNVFSCRELHALGVDRDERRSHVEGERWRAVAHRGVVIHHGPLVGEDLWRAALLSVGASACLGGISALQAAGMTGLDDEDTHVWVRKSFRKGRVPGVVLHESRRWTADDAEESGIPRARPAVAAMQAALWARTAKEAAFMLILPVQQRLVTADQLAEQLARVRRHRFRTALGPVIADIGGGSHSMHELDVIRMCRERGLPEPSRQSPRVGPGGRRYIDVDWPGFGITLEIQGAGHGLLLQTLDDDVRLVDLSTEGSTALSISVLTLRTNRDAFFDALERLFAAKGWRRTPPS